MENAFNLDTIEFNGIIPILVAVHASNKALLDLPFESQSILFRRITVAENAKLSQLTLKSVLVFKDTPSPLNALEVLKVEELKLGLFERSISQNELATVYSVEGLNDKHVKMLRDLGLPMLAGVFESGLTFHKA